MRESLDALAVNDSDTGSIPISFTDQAGNFLKPTVWAAAVASTQTATVYSATFDASWFDEALILANVSAISGTSPTFQVSYQVSPDGGNTWYPLYTTTSQTAIGKTGKTICSAQSASLGTLIRLGFTIGGTTPSVTFDCYVIFKPRV